MKLALLILILTFATLSAKAQGTFQNLNFESAGVPAGTAQGSLVPVSEAFPGWNAYFTSSSATVPAPQVSYDFVSLGGAAISLVDTGSVTPIQGNYSAFLFGGANSPEVGGQDGQLYSATISQTGTIPTGTETLLMDARSFGASPVVAIDGQPINMIPLQTFANYTLYGGNISTYSGFVETLSFTEPSSTTVAPTELLLDNISFSPQAIPEPSPFVLSGIGGLLFALYRRFAPKHK